MDINKFIKITLSFAALLISFSVFHYLVISLPAKDKIQLTKEQKEIEAINQIVINRKLLEDCLNKADELYKKDWEENCKLIRSNISNCSLPMDRANRLEKYRQQAKDNCFKQYPKYPLEKDYPSDLKIIFDETLTF